MDLQDRDKVRFLRRMWAVLANYANPDDTAQVNWMILRDFAPAAMSQRAGPIPRVAEFVAQIQDAGLVEEAVAALTRGLVERWFTDEQPRMQAGLKAAIREVLEEFSQAKMLEQLPLSQADWRALSVRWDLAEAVYAQRKSAAFDRCRTQGVDLHKRKVLWADDFPDRVAQCADILLGLLREKAHLDAAAALVADPQHTSAHAQRVASRHHGEFRALYGLMRDTFDPFVMEYLTDLRVETSGGKVASYVESLLEPFYEAGSDLRDRPTIPTPASIHAIREAAGPGVPMVKQKFVNSPVGANVVNGSITNSTVTQHTDQAWTTGIDAATLATELQALRRALQTAAETSGQLKDVAAVQEAAEAAQAGDVSGAVQKLKAVGQWVFDKATDIGVNVAAQVIGKTLGLTP